MSSELLFAGIQQGLILAMVSYAVMIPFRWLNCPDLTAEGAYPLGGSVAATVMLSGYPPCLGVGLAMLAAGVMGIATGLVHMRLKVNTLLAGIILSSMAWTVNLRLLKKPNIALFDVSSLFSSEGMRDHILVLLAVLFGCIAFFAFFLQTGAGLKLRAVGHNPQFAAKQGISVSRYTLLGLFLGGCMSGLAGSLMINLQHYTDVGMGSGIVIHALASLMLGEVLVGNATPRRQLLAPLVGAMLYQQIEGLVLSLGLPPTDLKCLTGVVILLVTGMRQAGKKHSVNYPVMVS